MSSTSADVSQADVAKDRLISLLDYCGAFSKLLQRDAVPRLTLPGGGFEGGPDSSFVLHDAVLRQLKTPSEKCVYLASRACDDCVWMKLRRPDDAASREAGHGKLLCAVYASLFSAHQEALREGRGAQVTVGVGLLRWKRSDGRVIDHPLVTIPAELQLDSDGALVIRMADGAQASLWPMPGVEDCSPALRRIEEADRSFECPLLGPDPPAPADREAWAPLLRRASFELAHDARYDETAPAVNAKGSLSTSPNGTPHIHNALVLWAHHDAGGLSVARDLAQLQESLRRLPPDQLPGSLARLTGIYDLPTRPPSCAPPPSSVGGLLAGLGRMLGFGGGGAATEKPKSGKPPFLYFGLASNSAQEQVTESVSK